MLIIIISSSSSSNSSSDIIIVIIMFYNYNFNPLTTELGKPNKHKFKCVNLNYE